MDGLLRSLGYTTGSVKDRYAQLNTDAQPPATPDPHPALLARFEEILRDAERRAETAFDLRPKAPVVVKREPPFTEKSAAAHYSFPAPDGTRPGIFWAPLPGPKFDVISMRTLVYHEGVPGHHFHLALQQELPEIPKFRQRRSFGGLSAFSEGWALYAEQLAVELGWYDGDQKASSASSTKNSSAPAASSSTPASTRRNGRANKPSTTASPSPKWSATS